ncbi:hypothetical protein F5Y01DRAFT_279132 [Xylaria sp. FL0043]|nr:hypothetical protein F5Y01DRAFT_279132 [Xylaria sp. FL0043]
MDPNNTPSNSSNKGPMTYLSTSEDGRTPETIIAIGTVLAALAIFFVAMRFYCRLRVTKAGLAADDWLMLSALILNIGMGLMLIIGASLHGLGQPTPQGWEPEDYFWVTDDAEIVAEKIFYAFILTQNIAFGFAKLSVLYFYRRIILCRTFKIVTSVMIVIVGIWAIGFFFAYLFRCGTNFWALWAPLEFLIEYCYDSKALFYTMAISDVITDFVILSLPLFWVWRLNMSIPKRFALSGVFLLGVLGISTGIARLVVYINQSKDFKKNADGIGHLTTLMVWSMVEMSIAVIAGCLPMIWPLVNQLSLEDMMRTLRSALSLESLNGSTKSMQSDANSQQYREQKDSISV